jgi:hypothetical protein
LSSNVSFSRYSIHPLSLYEGIQYILSLRHNRRMPQSTITGLLNQMASRS